MLNYVKDFMLVLMINGIGIIEFIVIWYILDIRVEDIKRYFNIGICYLLIVNINSIFFVFFFCCFLELDLGNFWY